MVAVVVGSPSQDHPVERSCEAYEKTWSQRLLGSPSQDHPGDRQDPFYAPLPAVVPDVVAGASS